MKSRLLSVEQPDAHSLVVRCTPMQWPHLDVPGDCTFEAAYRLVEENVIEMSARIINQRADKTLYSARRQEMPALYTNGPWYCWWRCRAMGAMSATFRAGTTADGRGSPYAPGAVAAQNDAGNGVGLYQPDTARFTGGFHGGRRSEGQEGIATARRVTFPRWPT
ncbi:MAG: hypothetical protein U1F77_18745 [Kiritimatiellia bacterium]